MTSRANVDERHRRARIWRPIVGLCLPCLILTGSCLADDLESLARELQALSEKLEYHKAQDVSLDEKQAYVNQILDIKRRISALPENEFPGKLQLVLSDVRVNGKSDQTTGAVTQQRECLVPVDDREACIDEGIDQGIRISRLFSVDRYPKRIVLGEPFSFSTKSTMRLEAAANRHCDKPRRKDLRVSGGIRDDGGQLSSAQFALNCGQRQVEGNVIQTFTWTPVKVEENRFYYSRTVAHSGSEPVKSYTERVFFEAHPKSILDAKGFILAPLPNYGDFDHQITIFLQGVAGTLDERATVELLYEIATPGAKPVRTTAATMPPSGVFVASEEPDSDSAGNAKAQNVDLAQLAGLPLPEAMARLTGVPTKIQAVTAKSKAQAGRVKTAYRRDGEETIVLQAYGKYVEQATVPEVVTLHLRDAVSAIKSRGLVPKIVLGGAAPSRKRSETVREVIPPAGSQVADASVVTLVAYGTYKAPAFVVPDLANLKPNEVRLGRLPASAKLNVKVGRAASSPKLAGRIYRQTPASGSEVPANGTITVTVYADYEQKPTPPSRPPTPVDVKPRLKRGMAFNCNRLDLRAAGFNPIGNSTGTVGSQDKVFFINCPGKPSSFIAFWIDAGNRSPAARQWRQSVCASREQLADYAQRPSADPVVAMSVADKYVVPGKPVVVQGRAAHWGGLSPQALKESRRIAHLLIEKIAPSAGKCP